MGSLAAETPKVEPVVVPVIGTQTERVNQGQTQRAKRRERMNKTVLGQSMDAAQANVQLKTLLGE